MKYIEKYDHKTGTHLKFDHPINAASLVQHLGIPVSHIGMVSVNNRIIQPFDNLPNNAMIKIFGPVFGG